LIVGTASALAAVFALALLGKASREGVDGHRRGVHELWPGRAPLPRPLLRVLAPAVLGAEALVLAALVGGTAVTVLRPDGAAWLLPGLLGATALLSAFTLAHALVLARGRRVACACFGRSSAVVGPVSVGRNGALSVLGATGALLVALGHPVATGPVALPAAVAGAALGLLLVNLEELVSLFRPARRTGPA
jgi:hypothetical protein